VRDITLEQSEVEAAAAAWWSPRPPAREEAPVFGGGGLAVLNPDLRTNFTPATTEWPVSSDRP
jgi:hypothetical protein